MDVHGRSEPSVASEPELGEDIQVDKNVVVVVIRIVEPEPWSVLPAFFEQLTLEEELRPIRYGPLHFG